MKKALLTCLIFAAFLLAFAQDAPKPYGVLPTRLQLKWHEMEMYCIVHFGVDTYTNNEWGYGDESPNIINPTKFDAAQIVGAAKSGGFKGVVIVAKHHDGFCLWPTKTTGRNITKSPFRHGKGDMIKEYQLACHKLGMQLGLYCSPWDRNNAAYGKPGYIQIYRDQIKELYTDYGPIFMSWHDGANGGDGYYGGAREVRKIDRSTYYDWPTTWAMIRKWQPTAAIFGDVGPDVRWVGNEEGHAGLTCWETYSPEAPDPGKEPANGYSKYEKATEGTLHGKYWLPAECDVPLRPGWFYHSSQDEQVKTPDQLLDLYYSSVGRGAGFDLGIAPDKSGLLNERDVTSLKKFGDMLRQTFAVNLAKGSQLTASNVRGNNHAKYGPAFLLDNDRYSYWATDDSVKTGQVVISLPKMQTFNVIRLREDIKLGQRITSFTVDAFENGQWKAIASGTSIGANRLVRLSQNVVTNTVRLSITGAEASIVLSDFGLFKEPVHLVAPLITRDKKDMVIGVSKQQPDLVSYVDPFIGTALHGHVFLGASVPFGAVQLGPVNISTGWDWCSGYNYSDSTIVGFAHTHLSGTGIGDLGDIEFMPTMGPIVGINDVAGKPALGTYSLFSHHDEVAQPGYYAVKLKRYNIDAEFTTTTRVGYHRYTFPNSAEAHMIINLQNGISSRPVDCYIEQLNDSTVIGYRYTKGWAVDRRIFFAAIFSKAIHSFNVYDNDVLTKGISLKSGNVKGILNFSTDEGEKLLVKVGISPVSTDNALLNLKAEANTWDFDQVKKQARQLWNHELEKVVIKADTDKMRTFYTALYHTMIAPSVFNDHNGDYLGTDKKVYNNATFENVTTLSLWDTYRAENPLMTLLQPERVNGLMNTMLAIYQQQGKLPVWHLMANETNTMVGYSGVPVVVDAFLKGYKDFDTKLAYAAVKATAMRDDKGLKFVKEQGFIPADLMPESVASGLEYAIDDWCIAQMAKKLGCKDDYEYFSKRAKNYVNYFDKSTHFMRGRVSATAWRTPFSPFVSRHMKDDFTEGNAWQYSWLVPQDVEGLIQLQGGEKAFANKLDSLFVAKGDMGKEASSDISGLIGQYAQGNEPSHHVAYLFNYVGQPYKTAEKVRFVMENFYTNKKDGIIGNEDVGQMSAWYVFSALGFYPVNPANGAYVLGSPIVKQATLNLADGKIFRISVKNNNAKNIYIQRIILNGKLYPKSYLLHKDIMKGGNLLIEMGAKPSAVWGINKKSRPFSTSG